MEDVGHNKNIFPQNDEQSETRSASESIVSDDNIPEEKDEVIQCKFSVSGYNLRRQAIRHYIHIFSHAIDNPANKQIYDMQLFQYAVCDMNKGGPTQPVFKHITGIIMTQMSDTAGIKKH